MAPNRVIGDQTNNIPWYLPADLKFFKKTTTGHHIIMGRKCYQSIGRPLPNRTNIVITRDPYFIASGVLVAHSISEALQLAYENGEQEAFIIGGGQIYELSKDLWDVLYMTQVDIEVEGNILFPKLDYDQWQLISTTPNEPDAKNKYPYTFELYNRKT
ncbi:UNVERIFIED_CONTAM: hypothetical protein GTU68_060902 [Idotea baltica]|nr:hypothetical protein [Idotea baltica]